MLILKLTTDSAYFNALKLLIEPSGTHLLPDVWLSVLPSLIYMDKQLILLALLHVQSTLMLIPIQDYV